MCVTIAHGGKPAGKSGGASGERGQSAATHSIPFCGTRESERSCTPALRPLPAAAAGDVRADAAADDDERSAGIVEVVAVAPTEIVAAASVGVIQWSGTIRQIYCLLLITLGQD